MNDPDRFAGRHLRPMKLPGNSWATDFSARVKEIYRAADARHGITPAERAKLPPGGWNDGSRLTKGLRPR